eukprot:15459551-Alexandrium_andersonii.AAC.1
MSTALELRAIPRYSEESEADSLQTHGVSALASGRRVNTSDGYTTLTGRPEQSVSVPQRSARKHSSALVARHSSVPL